MPGSGRDLTAFVLAGGGSLGAVQVGMLKALARHGLRPDLVLGASVGAINGACFAAQPSPQGVEHLERIWAQLRRADVFPFSPLHSLLALLGRRDHLVDPARLRALLEAELPCARLEDTAIPCCVIATDVLDGSEVALRSGALAPALLASGAIPGVFPPVELGGHHLMDGAVTNNTPISTALALGATRLVVLPTGLSCALERPPRGAVALALHALNLLVMRQLLSDIERYAQRAELIVVPPLCPIRVSAYDFSQSAELIQRAEAATRLWLQKGGLELGGAPETLLPHAHALP